MLPLPYQGDKDIGLTKSLKINLNKHLPNTLRRNLNLLVKSLALNLMLRIGPNLNTNMPLFILVNVLNRIVLIMVLVNLLGGSIISNSWIMVVESKYPIFLDML